MPTRADEDLFRSRLSWILAIAGILVLFEAGLIYLSKLGLKHGQIAIEVAVAVVPNFIAALFASVFVYLFVKDSDRANYVRAMRELRDTVHDLAEAEKTTPKNVQALMRRFVPAVSRLYFKQDEPEVSANERNLSYAKEKCWACNQPCPVVKGRCNESGTFVHHGERKKRFPQSRDLR